MYGGHKACGVEGTRRDFWDRIGRGRRLRDLEQRYREGERRQREGGAIGVEKLGFWRRGRNAMICRWI